MTFSIDHEFQFSLFNISAWLYMYGSFPRFHDMNKNMNSFRNPKKMFIIGKYVLNLQPLRDLVDASWATPFYPSDLLKHDPMNVPTSLRLISVETTSFLEELVPSGPNPHHGLIMFLTTMREFVYGFMDHREEYSLLDRIKDVATAISFCRYWRLDLSERKEDVSECFLTQNAFEGMELNLHSLVGIIVFLRLQSKRATLRPWLFGSQVNEREFRIARAYSPGGSTMVNVDMEGFLQRLKCILFDRHFHASGNLGAFHRRHGKDGDLQHPDPAVRFFSLNFMYHSALICDAF
jgi:hypothetical protein